MISCRTWNFLGFTVQEEHNASIFLPQKFGEGANEAHNTAANLQKSFETIDYRIVKKTLSL